MTPRLFDLLLREHRARRREQYTLIALLRRDLINFSFMRPKKPVQLEELLPPEEGEHEGNLRKPWKRMTEKRRQRVAGRIRAVMAPFLK